MILDDINEKFVLVLSQRKRASSSRSTLTGTGEKFQKNALITSFTEMTLFKELEKL